MSGQSESAWGLLALQLDFDAADLEANRRGFLSESQHARFAVGAASLHASSGVIQMWAVGSTAAMFLGMPMAGLMHLLGLQDLPQLYLLAMLGGAGIGYWFKQRHYGGAPPELPEPAVSCAEGEVSWSSAEGAGWGADQLFLNIGEQRLSVGAQRRAFVEGRHYRVYYTTAQVRIAGATPHTILSAEPR